MFQLAIEKRKLLPALLTVAGAVDKRQSLAILSNILLSVSNGRLVLTATDLEIEMSAVLDCDSVDTASQITVQAKKLIDIIRSLDDDAVAEIKLAAGAVAIKSGRSQFKLATLPADQFPVNDLDKSELEFIIQRESLIHLLQSTHFAMSQQDVRVFLNGLLLDIDGAHLTTVATDGHRMAICKFQCDHHLPSQRFLLPRKGVQEMLRLLAAVADESIVVTAGKGHFRLVTEQYTFSTKLIEARFPPYTKAIPTDQDKFVLIDRDILKRSLSRIAILANEKSRAVLIHIQASSLTLIANNQEQEEASELLEAHVDGQELKIGINAGYLLDVLAYLPDGLVRLSMSTTDKSILVESLQDANYQYIIMPMKL
ncbi:DNA polymerase III subunit beta [Legionella taurinensis]|uniref:Beta sliding clamp n=1 Tax=Legionella taurinensis TaxID=70611 RepID=A0AB38N885_9GAMM|nr:DNA polymerase III subunit beta [Legionella taurinensis]MDX1836226.1 DNA polymerase III subunit beta [Legionella taurinensis]PUT42014.1 DNA polymerase III subunit beta [Legionella taurinensis]PUT44801.1 DNA polymerase III subunit beta [Legionella taurinensis]PUT48122.1 DNA polymerase III subunit beta [Legionella taurinensis]PUT48936.1 DNA polymerase III subunit beta [Legionella taurinensis]